MRPLHRAFGTAGVASFTAFAASIYLFGIPARFPVFFLRSLTVILLVFVLTFQAIDRTPTSEDKRL
jgi:hypothetical protein